VASAVLLPDDIEIPGLDDSKTIASSRREYLLDSIMEATRIFGIGTIGSTRIDQTNILAATLEAMFAAVQQVLALHDGPVGIVVVDGNQTIPGLAIPQRAWPKGDHLSRNCAAASIIAKVTRDRLMESLDRDYPGYGFARHKGYGTPEHLDALRRLGPCPIHRCTFAPIAARPPGRESTVQPAIDRVET
jgi:ribonuclease HII